MKRAVVLITDDGEYSGFYIDGNLIEQGETLGEGENFTYLLRMSEKYLFTYEEYGTYELFGTDNAEVCFNGFPADIDYLDNIYGLK
jgi:hypothetical protein